MSLKQQLTEDMKAAMKSGDKHSLGVIRLVNAAIKQREVDERIELDDAAVLAVLDKMVKQRRDSVSQYETAAREDLAEVERAEIVVIERYLPAKLDEAAILAAIDAAIAKTGASGAADASEPVNGAVTTLPKGRSASALYMAFAQARADHPDAVVGHPARLHRRARHARLSRENGRAHLGRADIQRHRKPANRNPRLAPNGSTVKT